MLQHNFPTKFLTMCNFLLHFHLQFISVKTTKNKSLYRKKNTAFPLVIGIFV